MRLAAIAGFATGTAIVLWTFLRQHSTSTIEQRIAVFNQRLAASNRQLASTTARQRSLSEAVWAVLEAAPGFNEAMKKGEADIAAGLGTPFRELRRSE